jgi:hypothetical protein
MNIDRYVVALIKSLLRRVMMSFFRDANGNVFSVGDMGSSGFTSCSTSSMAVSGYQKVSSGNRAFDEYREETLKRLAEDRKLFEEFMERLRLSKDKAEFDQFMAQRDAAEKSEKA